MSFRDLDQQPFGFLFLQSLFVGECSQLDSQKRWCPECRYLLMSEQEILVIWLTLVSIIVGRVVRFSWLCRSALVDLLASFGSGAWLYGRGSVQNVERRGPNRRTILVPKGLLGALSCKSRRWCVFAQFEWRYPCIWLCLRRIRSFSFWSWGQHCPVASSIKMSLPCLIWASWRFQNLTLLFK